jgi:hypothetical protein
MTTQQFDVKTIIGIKTVEEAPHHSYVWEEASPAYTKFFGLIKVPEKPEGFRDLGSVSSNVSSGEDLEKRGYNVKDKTVFCRPHATVYLEHEYQVQKTFTSNAEMFNWVNQLKKSHGGNFEIVNYKR